MTDTFKVTFYLSMCGEFSHSTTINISRIMPHMCAAMIAAGLSSYWNDDVIRKHFIPALRENKRRTYSPGVADDTTTSVNAFLVDVNALHEFFIAHYDEDTNFREELVDMIVRVFAAKLGDL